MNASSPKTIKLLLVLVGWFALGLVDFVTGFVEYSPVRLILLILFALFLLPLSFHLPSPFARIQQRVKDQPGSGYAFLLMLTLLGYALFISRYVRGANMGDDPVFEQVIANTAGGCLFCFPAVRGSYFAVHNLFLVLFAPLTVFPGWWPLIHLIHSFVIVIWCRVCGWVFGGKTILGWYITTAMFLATFVQHAAFYYTRFAALGLAIFAVGFYLRRQRLMLGAGIATLITRETAALFFFMFGLLGALIKPYKKMFLGIAAVGLLWWLGSYLLILMAGGPIVPRFDDCLRLSPGHFPDGSCFQRALSTDWPLKFAYTLRLVRFAPTLGALPSLFAAMPDLALTWISKDNVLYSLSWHYYMQTLGILIVGAGLTTQMRFLKYSDNLLIRWVVATALWQFVTTFRPNLF